MTSTELSNMLVQHPVIEGLYYAKNIITEDDEADLLEVINEQNWSTELYRRVQHYGYKYDYGKRKVDKNDYLGKLPSWTKPLTKKLLDLTAKTQVLLPYTSFDQLIINEYKKGQGIGPHRDCIPCFKDGIFSVTIGEPGVMTFEHPTENTIIDVELERRSVAVLTGNARYKWTHAIIPSKNKHFTNDEPRISLTFRKIIE